MDVRDFSNGRDSRRFLANMLTLCNDVQNSVWVGNDLRASPGPILSGQEQIWGIPEGETTLACSYFDFGNGSCIVLGGARDYFNVSRFMAASNVFRSNPDYNGFAPLVTTFANTAFNFLTTVPTRITLPLFLVGYSLGGCVCYQLADFLVASLRFPTCIWTFGSPRPGGPAAQQIIDRRLVKRYYCIDDPVRAMPPHFDEAWSIWPLIDQFTRNKWNAQVQPAGGICIDGGGYFIESPDVFPMSGGEVFWDAARYMLGLEVQVSSNHSIDTYRTRILKLPDTAAVVPLSPTRPREEPPALPTPAQTRNAIAIGEAAQEVAARTQTTPRTIIVSTNVASPSSSYKAHKLGKLWGVSIDGEIVAMGPGKRAARRLAHRWNKASSGR